MLQQLYNGLLEDDNISISFEQFKNKFENDFNYRQNLHAGIVEDGDFSGDYNTFESKFLGKTTDSSTETQTTESNVMDSGSDDGSLELPQVTMKDVDVPERQTINRFKKKFGGLGFEFDQAGYGTDRVVIYAPPEFEGQPKEDREKLEIQTDLDLFGFSTYSDKLWGASSKQTAQDVNDFVKKYSQGSPVNPQTYASAWNTVDTYKVEGKDGKPKEIKDLSSEELTKHMKSAYNAALHSENLPGIKNIFEEINVSLEDFTKTTVNDLKNKYDLTDQKQVDLANKELKQLITKKQDELFDQNQELKNIQESVFKAVESKFGSTLDDKLRKEAEEMHLPPWVTSFNSDYIRQGYVTAAIKFPKALKEINILHQGIALKEIGDELGDLNSKIKQGASLDEKYIKRGAPGKEGLPTVLYEGTIGDRIKNLQSKKFDKNKSIAFKLAEQQDYQKKLEDVRVPTIFGKDISDPDLTIDEWQGMLGDQTVQMISAVLTMGGSTYIQEGGGAALDIIEIEAAKKMFPPGWNEMKDLSQAEKNIMNLMKPKDGKDDITIALEAFRKLPKEKRAAAMADILDKGEANLNPAVTVGATNAGLDLVSNFFVIGKATKFAPKSLGRDLLRGRVGRFLSEGYETVGKDLGKASLMEFVTETAQEGTSITGVGVSTGYYGNKDANIKRLAEAGGQALLSTGPLVGAGKVATTTTKELRAKTGWLGGKDLQSTRQSINQIKKEYEQYQKDGVITIDQLDEVYTELEAQEDFVNNTKYKNLSNDEKIKVIDNLVEIANQKKDLTKLENESKKTKKQQKDTGGLNPNTIQNDIKGEIIKNKIKELQLNNLKELWKNDLTTNLEFAEWINNQTEGFFADKAVMTFDNVEDAKNFIEGNNLEQEAGKNPLEVAINLKMLYDGDVNGANLGNVAIIINDNVRKNIDANYGDWSSSNVVHHEAFHFILDAIPVSELQTVRNQVISELEASTDPKIQAALKLHKDKMDLYTEDKRTREYNEEWFAVLSDAMRGVKNSDINLENGIALEGVGKIFGGLFQGVTKKGFDFTKFDAQNALEFIKKYNDFNGKSPSLVLPGIKGKVDAQPPKKKGAAFKGSKALSPLEAINNLIPDTVKTQEDYYALLSDPRVTERVFDGRNLAPVIEAYIRSRSTSPEMAQKNIEAVRDRLVNFDPAAERADGSLVGPEGFGEFIFANARFGKMVAAEKLAIEAAERKRTKSIDTEEAMQVADKPTTKKPGTSTVKTKLKQTKSRQLTSLADLDVESSPLIKETTKIQLKKLIKSNPKNLIEEIQKVLIPDLVEITRKEMGIIGEKAGKLNIPDTYFAYLADTYAKTISSMEIEKIRANYKNLFKKEKMGFADYKTKKSDKPSLKKDSNYRKEIFRNVTTKAEFTKYHTEGKKNKLIANQRNLAIMRAEAEVVRAAENYIIENSENLNEVYAAELRNFIDSKTVEKQKQENKSFDSVKFSKSMALAAFEVRDAVLTGENVFDNNGNLIETYKNILKNKKDSKAVGDFVWANLHLLSPDTDFRFLVKAYEKLYSEDRGTEYERNLIKTAELVEKEYGIDAFEVVLRKPTEKDALPDMIFKIHGQVMNVEAKMALAQYSSVTNSIVDGKMTIEKQYSSEFMKILTELQKESQEGIKKAKKFLKENKIEWDGFKLLSTEGHNMLINTINPDTGSSYFNGMSATLPLPLKFIAEIYNNKKHPVYLMQLMGRGLFSMGGDTFNLGIPALEDGGDGFITLRVGSNSQYRVATEADVKAKRVTSIYTDGTNVSEKLTKGLKPLLKIGSTITKKAGEDALLDLFDKLDRIDGANAEALASDLGMAIELMQDGYAKDATKRLKQFNKKSKDILSGASKTKRQVKTGMKTYSYRSIPGISDNVLNNMKSTHNIENLAGMMKLMDSKEVANIKTRQEGKSKTSFSKSVNSSRTVKDSKGITVLDFDDTLATTKSLVKYTKPDGTTGTLNAEEYASTYEDLLDKGFTFDFSDFNKVVKGKLAPLFNKAMKLQGKFGPENMFVLTARPPQAAKAIFDFLKANGLNIPLKNITGLANSTSEAKALWIADKVGEGYNDFYFADDALQNVQAVKNMLDQFDVKSKVQQAKVKFSKGMNDRFNDILEDVTGIEAKKRFSAIKGRKRGESKGKFRYFIPPSHEDFVGLLYNFLGKGKEGNAHRDFFEQALIRPLNRANREYDTARQSVANDYKALNKQFVDVRKKLTKKTPDGDFTFQDAIRVYLWDKHGHSIPGLSPTDQQNLVDLVTQDSELQAYAETINVISRQDTYVTPTDGWNSGDIRVDLDDATGRIGRQQFFGEFIENTDIIFSEENLNKIEAGYGKGVRESLEDMLYRIKTGRNRPTGQNEQVNKLMNYLNGSVGTVMFFNMRSALLQQMSLVNYINFADNNIFAAAKAFANQKQYWNDWAFIFNSDMLKQRRGGIQTDINGAELAASLRNSKDMTRKLISKLLELGFLPTQIGDNIAISTGGATFYRNRINTYLKQGLSKKEAETKAFDDFQALTQSTQQSARPDMVSKQQASVIGKVILNFQNVTSQFNRLGKKAFQDIYNRRITKPNATQMQSDISNAARITYYFAIQNAIFYTLQTALFAMMFDDDEEDDNKLFLKKKERLINGSIDSVLRGSGLVGGVVATLKNVAIAFARQRDVNYNPDESAVALEALNLSPVLGIKLRKIVNAEKTLNYNKKVMKEMETFDIDNPQWSAVTNYTEALTNVPLNRLYNKTQNVRQALNNDHSNWERTLMFLGWSQYNLNLENKKIKDIKESIKSKKKKKTKSKSRKTRSVR